MTGLGSVGGGGMTGAGRSEVVGSPALVGVGGMIDLGRSVVVA